MTFLAMFHWGWLAAAALIGLAMGWIAVVHRAPPATPAMLAVAAAIVAALIAAALAHLLPGRIGYWCDLGLALFALYLAGCTVGSMLREWVIARHAATK